MSRSGHYYVYIVTNRRGTLYTGVTNDLQRRVAQHQLGESAFTRPYRIGKLVHYEVTTDVRAAIAREKQIKGWTRAKKLALVSAANPAWKDLSKDLWGMPQRVPCHVPEPGEFRDRPFAPLRVTWAYPARSRMSRSSGPRWRPSSGSMWMITIAPGSRSWISRSMLSQIV